MKIVVAQYGNNRKKTFVGLEPGMVIQEPPDNKYHADLRVWVQMEKYGYYMVTNKTCEVLGIPRAQNEAIFIKPESDAEMFHYMMGRYDWFYEMSDDFGVYGAGRKYDAKCRAFKEKIGLTEFVRIWNLYAPEIRKLNEGGAYGPSE